MKNSINIVLASAFVLFLACSKEKGSSTEDLKVRLDEIKSEMKKLETEAKDIEQKLAISGKDTSKTIQKIVPVAVESLNPGPFKHYISVQGVLEAKETSMISSKMPGQIVSVLVSEGNQVSKGQLLAVLDKEILQKSIDELENGLDLANNLFQKQKNLWDQKIGSEVQYLNAKNGKESLEKKLVTLKAQLNQLNVYSPFTGTINEVYAKVGGVASPGIPLFKIVSMSDIKATAKVPDIYINSIKVGDEVKISLPDLNLQSPGNLKFVSQVVDPISRTIQVEATITNRTQEFKPNVLCLLNINDAARPNAIVISENLIQNSENGKFVFIGVENAGQKTAKVAYVKTGLSYDGKVEIIEGLSANDKLITDGYADLVDGSLISF